MGKTFIIFYEHTKYGYYTTEIEANDIHDALTDFDNECVHNGIYGIMEKK